MKNINIKMWCLFLTIGLFNVGCTTTKELFSDKKPLYDLTKQNDNEKNDNLNNNEIIGDDIKNVIEFSKKDKINNSFSTIYFDYNSFEIDEISHSKILENLNILKKYKNSSFILEGNCDEYGSDEYNNALGLKRANTVKQILINIGMEENKIGMKSFGESNPACVEKTKECDSKNRRVEFKISK
jgi:peptidoglycan-associated lipoprotein